MPHEEHMNASIKITLPDGTVVERETTLVKIIKILDFLTLEQRHSPVPESQAKIEGDIEGDAAQKAKKFIIPSKKRLEKFIRTKPNLEHTLEDAVIEFAERPVNSSESKDAERYLNAMRSKLLRIRREIKKTEKGEWEEEREGNFKRYRFIKSSNEGNNERPRSLLTYEEDKSEDND